MCSLGYLAWICLPCSTGWPVLLYWERLILVLNCPAVHASVVGSSSCCELTEVSSAGITCASWEIRMFSCSLQSWLAHILPVTPILLAGMCFTHSLSSSLLQRYSFRMWQNWVWWVLLIISHKVHWDNALFFFFFYVIAPLGLCGHTQSLHMGWNWSLVGSVTKVVAGALIQPFSLWWWCSRSVHPWFGWASWVCGLRGSTSGLFTAGVNIMWSYLRSKYP